MIFVAPAGLVALAGRMFFRPGPLRGWGSAACGVRGDFRREGSRHPRAAPGPPRIKHSVRPTGWKPARVLSLGLPMAGPGGMIYRGGPGEGSRAAQTAWRISDSIPAQLLVPPEARAEAKIIRPAQGNQTSDENHPPGQGNQNS